MLGTLIASLDNPDIATRLVTLLDEPDLTARLEAAASTLGRAPAEVTASLVRNFVETASDDLWLQLIGIMNRAEDPSLAAIRAILGKTLPAASV
ncbi:MAG: hypothetical protein WBA29_10565 [Xanthobacteraceae bacterium]